MKLLSKIIREVLKQFYNIFFLESRIIIITFNNISNYFIKDKKIEPFKIVYILLFATIIFCIVIGLFASNNRIRGIAISITGGFLIYELLILILVLFKYLQKDHEEQETERFVDNFINVIKINALRKRKYFAVYMILNSFLNILDNTSEDSILKFFSPCVELSIYIIIFIFSNRLISIDRTLVLLVLTIMSLKTCFESFFNKKEIVYTVFFKITKYDILYLITYTILFILSSYVKHVRDILVRLTLSVFYSIILSLLISFIYYETNDFFNRLKLLLLDEDVLKNKENFLISKEKLE
ncbi:hypothetical protein HERIO_1397 [Hepatospora eriocheir]|uniref:Uncharacterized protein n=1 Tax=Hepatospora eriocheir TaxID=1081669 RepID=A0A1X0QA67_9MICR|nr:hypothetical protein HERIO_1397 [Hepatospora eriocheir]